MFYALRGIDDFVGLGQVYPTPYPAPVYPSAYPPSPYPTAYPAPLSVAAPQALLPVVQAKKAYGLPVWNCPGGTGERVDQVNTEKYCAQLGMLASMVTCDPYTWFCDPSKPVKATTGKKYSAPAGEIAAGSPDAVAAIPIQPPGGAATIAAASGGQITVAPTSPSAAAAQGGVATASMTAPAGGGGALPAGISKTSLLELGGVLAAAFAAIYLMQRGKASAPATRTRVVYRSSGTRRRWSSRRSGRRGSRRYRKARR